MTKTSIKLLVPFVLAGILAFPAEARPTQLAEMSPEEALKYNMLDAEEEKDREELEEADKGVMVIAQSSTSSAAKPKKKAPKKKGKDGEAESSGISAQNPLYVTADRMHYNDATGDVDAMGRVIIRHMMDNYQTEYVYGNTLAQKYVIPGELKWVNPTTKMKAARADYDAAKGIGHFENLDGWDSNTYYFKGSAGVYDRNDNKILVQNGYFTTKHAVAKVPDYRIEADSIDIYPGDHYTAHNVKLMAKNTTLITLASYSGSLVHDEGAISLWSLIPRPVFDSDNGFGLHNELHIPLGGDPDLEIYLKNRWYTKSGYKSDMGIRYRTPLGTAKFFYAEQESTTNDDGGIWVKKKPAFSFDTRHFYLFGSRFYVGAYGEIAKWDEDQGRRHPKGTYKGFDAYISSNPWKLGKFVNFSWKAGYAKDYYSFDDYFWYKGHREKSNVRRNGYYSLGLSGGYGPIRAWVNYTDRDIKGYTRYRYDSYSSEKPLGLGFRWQATHMDAFSLSWTIDTVDGHLDHRYWTYYRDMHSFYAWIRYDDIEHETKFMIMPKDFKF